MIPSRSLLRALIFFLLLSVSAFTQAQITDLNSAINKAGRERMLSQRMAKLYLQIGMDVDAVRSKRTLDASIALFEQQLLELKNFAPTPEIGETYIKLEKHWRVYKKALVGAPPSHANGNKVLDLSEEVLSFANLGTVQLERHAGSTPVSRLINIAGRQRMLSQRMAKVYQAAAWHVGSTQQFKWAHKDFSDGLRQLEAAPINTPALRDELDRVKQHWMVYENALNQRANIDKAMQSEVATYSERILESLENVVGLYVAQGHASRNP
jgi:nitrate/nitrite-specific signal transduction histidine kinase